MPTWVSTTNSNSGNWTTTHTVDMPATVGSGDILVLLWGSNGAQGATVTAPDSSSDWVQFASENPTNSKRFRGWLKLADGTEGGTSVTITTSRGIKSASQVVQTRGGFQSTAEGTGWSVSSVIAGYGTAADPAEVTAAWGSSDNLYVAFGYGGDRTVSIDTFPTGYSNGDSSANQAMVCSATKEATSSSDDPDSFMLSASDVWEAGTLALRGSAETPAFVSSTASEEDPGTTTHTMSTPDAEPGDWLVAMFGSNGTQNAVVTGMDDWDIRISEDPLLSKRWRVWTRLVTEVETAGTETITTSETVESAMLVYRISGAYAYNVEGTAFDVSTGTSGFDTSPDPDSLSPTWGDALNFYVAVMFAGDQSVTVSAGPAGYSNLNSGGTTTSPQVAAATSVESGASEDPGAFTISVNDVWNAATLVFRPAGVSASAETAAATATGVQPTVDPPTVTADAETATAAASAHLALPVQPQVPSDLVIEWDLDGDGDFDETEEDITGYVTAGSLIVGRDLSSTIQGRSRTGSMRLVLDNSGGEFGFFNTSSALNTAPFSTKTGRRIRLRTTTATPTDPVLLTRDLFSGNGTITDPEVGASWNNPSGFGGFSANSGTAIADGPPDTTGSEHVITSATGETSGYCQAMVNIRDRNNSAGVVFYWTSGTNYGRVYLRDQELVIEETVSGTVNELATAAVENRSNVAVGVAFDGTDVIAYLDGVQQATATTTLTATGRTGLYADWLSQRAPTFDEFYSWDRSRVIQAWDTTVDQAGVLATMRVTRVEPAMDRSGRRIATLTANGDLSLLDRPVTPTASVGFDTEQSAGITAGEGIGNTLAKAGALHPPGPIDAGTITLGSVGLDRQQGISVARAFENTEVGFIYELPEGGVGFDNRTARDSSSVAATFSDDPTEAIIGIETIRQRDWQGDLVNEVTSEVTAEPPNFSAAHQTREADPGPNDVDVLLPTEADGAEAGDLCIVAVSSTVQSDGVFWITPPGWRSLRLTLDEGPAQRVWAKTLTDSDIGPDLAGAVEEKFYDDIDSAGGQWVSTWFLVKNWFGSVESGVAISEHGGYGSPNSVDEANLGTNDPPWLATPWSKTPTLFLCMRAGIGSTSGTTVSTASDDLAPDGFDNLASIHVEGTLDADDVAHQYCRRTRTEDIINPSPFGGEFTGFDTVETVTIAVRGYNGDPPVQTGGQEVTSQNSESQRDRDAVLSHPNPGLLFGSEDDAEAYNDYILTRFDQDRPILDVSFTATKNGRHRARAVAGLLSDRVRVVAENRSVLGIDAEFFVEQIIHEFGSGLQSWTVTYGLSPATDSGGGADE